MDDRNFARIRSAVSVVVVFCSPKQKKLLAQLLRISSGYWIFPYRHFDIEKVRCANDNHTAASVVIYLWHGNHNAHAVRGKCESGAGAAAEKNKIAPRSLTLIGISNAVRTLVVARRRPMRRSIAFLCVCVWSEAGKCSRFWARDISLNVPEFLPMHRQHHHRRLFSASMRIEDTNSMAESWETLGGVIDGQHGVRKSIRIASEN